MLEPSVLHDEPYSIARLTWTSQYFTKAMNGGEEAGLAMFAMNAALYAKRQMK